MTLAAKTLRYIRKHSLLLAGERVGVAVSGGADSVALLRLLLELRAELGIYVAVAHFNHGIRGQEADEDEEFVRRLAEEFQLEFHRWAANTWEHSAAQRTSLESAARELRLRFFRELRERGRVEKIATAHTADDQAETVLMRMLRGAGTKGLAGIYPRFGDPGLHLVRPLLSARRAELKEHLRGLNQAWREDSSNRDLRHTRNRVRHELMPLLERSFNPNVAKVLADNAEIARAEEEYWSGVVEFVLPQVRGGTEGIRVEELLKLPLAVRRRVLRAAAQDAGLPGNFDDVEELRGLAEARPLRQAKTYSLRQGRALVQPGAGGGELHLLPPSGEQRAETPRDYEYHLSVPGETLVPEINSFMRAKLVPNKAPRSAAMGAEGTGYNQRHFHLLNLRLLPAELTVRNWRAGDRFWPAGTKSPKKIKELLQRVPRAERRAWPVVLSGNEIIWMRGFPPREKFVAGSGTAEGLLIEETAAFKRSNERKPSPMRSKD